MFAFTSMDLVRGIVILILGVCVVGWIVIRSVKRADNPARRVFHWVLTFPTLVMIAMAIPLFGVFGPFVIVGCAVLLSIIWTPVVVSRLISPLTSAFDGGDLEPELKPAYSIAEARVKSGKYTEAIEELQRQLEKFPNDFTGQMMLARVYAENLHDIPAARGVIQAICNQPEHPPAQIVGALYCLADFYLGVSRDPEAAREVLQQVVNRYPDSQLAAGAAQRIAHLASPEFLAEVHNPHHFELRPGIHNLGLLNGPHVLTADPALSSTEQAAEYVRHLMSHPLDTEAREKLAILYADGFNRLDLAAGELEQLIGMDQQPHRLKVRWLNTLADIELRCGAGYDTVKATLQRIIELDPRLAAAEHAQKRIDLLRLEMKAKEKSQAVKLGSYEQNIGLKGRSPRRGEF